MHKTHNTIHPLLIRFARHQWQVYIIENTIFTAIQPQSEHKGKTSVKLDMDSDEAKIKALGRIRHAQSA
jgi:hypothetical protein